ncbi:50S ribosomal protein L31e [Candidatus Woesearchaeota archaeon]|nr:50S ribosomal protein L31e [Candidatus Woesearchaeota archaeon]
MAKKEPKVKLERSYNIPLRKSFRLMAKHKKTPRAVRAVKEFLAKHMKSDDIQLGMHLNEYLWKHGIRNPPHHVKVHVIKEDDVVKAELEGFEFKGAVKAEPKKKEPTTMKEKLAKKMGIEDVAEEQAEEKQAEAKEEKQAEAKEEKTEAKAEEKKAEEKKPEPKPEVKKSAPKAEKVPTAHELAAKKDN